MTLTPSYSGKTFLQSSTLVIEDGLTTICERTVLEIVNDGGMSLQVKLGNILYGFVGIDVRHVVAAAHGLSTGPHVVDGFQLSYGRLRQR